MTKEFIIFILGFSAGGFLATILIYLLIRYWNRLERRVSNRAESIAEAMDE